MKQPMKRKPQSKSTGLETSIADLEVLIEELRQENETLQNRLIRAEFTRDNSKIGTIGFNYKKFKQILEEKIKLGIDDLTYQKAIKEYETDEKEKDIQPIG